MAVHVLAVVTQLNRGGLECRLMDIVRNIDFSRIQLDIFTTRQDPGMMDQEAISCGCKIYYNKPLNVQNMVSYVKYFANFLRTHPEYRIVHAHQDAWCSVFCKGAYIAGVPIRIAHSRISINNTKDLNSLAKNLIKRPTVKYATHYFAVSDLAGEWLFGKKNMENGKVWVWPNAIECERYEFQEAGRLKKRKEFGVEGNIVVAYVGNIRRGKNPEKLLKVFKSLTDKKDSARLIVTGNVPDDIKLMAERLGITDKVMFLGMRTDVNEILWASDVLLHPSLFEGMPGCVLEAQAAGLPCLISDTITKQVCITPLVTQMSLKEDDGRWADKLIELQAIGHKDEMEAIRAAGYDIKSLVRKLEEFYEEESRGAEYGESIASVPLDGIGGGQNPLQ